MNNSTFPYRHSFALHSTLLAYLCCSIVLAAEPNGVQHLLNEDAVRALTESSQDEIPTVRSVYAQDDGDTAPPVCASEKQFESALKSLSKITLQIAPLGTKLPTSCFSEGSQRPYCTNGTRSPVHFYMHWHPSEVAHNPIYFQDVALERYGQGRSPCFQPLVSGAKFVGTAFSLPYRMGVDHPHELIYALGYERPGNYAPCVYEQLPWNKKAALLQAGAIVTGAYLYP